MPFQPFTPAHFATLCIGSAMVAGLIWVARRSKRWERVVSLILVCLNFLAFPMAWIAWRDYPRSLDNILPFHLCDLAAIVAGCALLTRKPILLTLTYFWGIAATTQALVTPAITVGPPHLPFYHFFVQHFAIVAAALYIPIVLKWRPSTPWWRTPLVVFAISLAYQGAALVLNSLLGTNFAFASRPPANPSLIDHLGPWPVYLFAMQFLALCLFFVLILPFWKRLKPHSR